MTDPEHPLPRPAWSELRFEEVHLSCLGSAGPALRGQVQRAGAGDARDPDAGRMTLGGLDLRDLVLDDVRVASAWAPQSPQVLGGTPAGNLRLAVDDGAEDTRGTGAEDTDDAALEAVLRAVGLDDVLARAGPHGWIGESGERLSAGERARVGLARALLSPARLLLVDEPSAHLDAGLTARVLDLLAAQRRSVLLVTHDPGVLDHRWCVVALDAAGVTSAVMPPAGATALR